MTIVAIVLTPYGSIVHYYVTITGIVYYYVLITGI